MSKRMITLDLEESDLQYLEQIAKRTQTNSEVVLAQPANVASVIEWALGQDRVADEILRALRAVTA